MSTTGLVLKLVLSLAGVVGLILLLQRLAHRYGRAFGASGTEKIRILGQRPVGPRMSLALVQVLERTILIGISPQGIRAVADLGGPEAASAGEEPPGLPLSRTMAEPQPFETELERRLGDLRRRYPSVLDLESGLRGGAGGGAA
jgi:flagellar biogenesis protein FliO